MISQVTGKQDATEKSITALISFSSKIS